MDLHTITDILFPEQPYVGHTYRTSILTEFHKLTSKRPWVSYVWGLLLILLVISNTLQETNRLNAFILAALVPTIFLILGYTTHYARTWKEFLQLTLMDARKLLLPYIAFNFTFYAFQFFMSGQDKTWELVVAFWYPFSRSLMNASRSQIGDVLPVTMFWILVPMFTVRLIARLLRQLMSLIPISWKYLRYAFWTIGTIIGFCGIFWCKGLEELSRAPKLSFDIALALVFFYTLGNIWHEFRKEIKRLSPYVLMFIIAVCLFYVVRNSIHRDYMNLSKRVFIGTGLGIPNAIMASILVLEITNQFSRIPVFEKILHFIGSHPLWFMFFHYYDSLVAEDWSNETPIGIYPNGTPLYTLISIFLRIALIIASTLVVTSSIAVFQNKRHRFQTFISADYGHVFEVLFYMVFGYALLHLTLKITYLTDLIALDTNVTNQYMQWMIIPAYLCFAYSIRKTKNQTILTFQLVILVLSFMYRLFAGKIEYYLLIMLVLGASYCSLRIISKEALLIYVTTFICAYYASMHGYIPYNVTEGKGLFGAHAFGTIGANLTSFLLMDILFAYCLIRDNRRKIECFWDYPLMVLILLFNYRYVHGRTGFYISLMMVMITFLHQCLQGTPIFTGKIARILQLPLIFIYPVLMTITIFVYRKAYTSQSFPFQNIFDSLGIDTSTLHARFTFGGSIIVHNVTKAFTNIELSSRHVTSEKYFFLDSDYLRLPYMYGIVFTLVLITLYTLLLYRAYRESHYLLFLLLSVYAITGTVETLFADPQKSFVLLGTFSYLYNSSKKSVLSAKTTVLGKSAFPPKDFSKINNVQNDQCRILRNAKMKRDSLPHKGDTTKVHNALSPESARSNSNQIEIYDIDEMYD